MWKKIVLGTLLAGLIGFLVAGAIIRTLDKTGNVAEASGLGHGRGAGNGSVYTGDQVVQGEGYGRNATGTVERLYPNYENPPEDWATYEGAVVTAPQAGVNMVIKTGDGEEIVIGTGPNYLEGQGLTLEAGEQVRVYGYWQDGEFKAAQVTRLRDGQVITLRDQIGRPAWSGAVQAAGAGGQGGYDGVGRTDAPGDGTGTGQAQVDEWLTLQGTVTSVDADTLVVQTDGGEQVTVNNRAWWFAQDQGFATQAGDRVTLTGFYEDGDFEVGQIDDLTTGQTVTLRDDSGRPSWAGRGRRGG
jgi:hypothetical protein